jgi:hypothetical protein
VGTGLLNYKFLIIFVVADILGSIYFPLLGLSEVTFSELFYRLLLNITAIFRS